MSTVEYNFWVMSLGYVFTIARRVHRCPRANFVLWVLVSHLESLRHICITMFSESLRAMKTPNFRQVGIRHTVYPFVLNTSDDFGTQTLLEFLRVISFIIPMYMIWIGLGLVANTESPIVVVLRYVSLEAPFARTLTSRAWIGIVGLWNRHSTVGTCFFSLIPRVRGIKRGTLWCTRLWARNFL